MEHTIVLIVSSYLPAGWKVIESTNTSMTVGNSDNPGYFADITFVESCTDNTLTTYDIAFPDHAEHQVLLENIHDVLRANEPNARAIIAKSFEVTSSTQLVTHVKLSDNSFAWIRQLDGNRQADIKWKVIVNHNTWPKPPVTKNMTCDSLQEAITWLATRDRAALISAAHDSLRPRLHPSVTLAISGDKIMVVFDEKTAVISLDDQDKYILDGKVVSFERLFPAVLWYFGKEMQSIARIKTALTACLTSTVITSSESVITVDLERLIHKYTIYPRGAAFSVDGKLYSSEEQVIRFVKMDVLRRTVTRLKWQVGCDGLDLLVEFGKNGQNSYGVRIFNTLSGFRINVAINEKPINDRCLFSTVHNTVTEVIDRLHVLGDVLGELLRTNILLVLKLESL